MKKYAKQNLQILHAWISYANYANYAPLTLLMSFGIFSLWIYVHNIFTRDFQSVDVQSILGIFKVFQLKMVKQKAWATISVESKLRVNDCGRADEANFKGECNGVPGLREQPNNAMVRKFSYILCHPWTSPASDLFLKWVHSSTWK